MPFRVCGLFAVLTATGGGLWGRNEKWLLGVVLVLQGETGLWVVTVLRQGECLMLNGMLQTLMFFSGVL